MRTFIKYLSFAGALALGLSASAPAAAFSVALQPLHQYATNVAVVGNCRQANVAAGANGTPFFEMPGIPKVREQPERPALQSSSLPPARFCLRRSCNPVEIPISIAPHCCRLG
jgi:hypothetical protein